jgi:hypothetical protein
MSDLTAERVARNDAIFREANEKIRDSAEELEFADVIPLICECADPNCTQILRLTIEDYERVRSDPTHFINAKGHVTAAQGFGEIVEEGKEWDIIAKVGPAAEIVEELDPRART